MVRYKVDYFYIAYFVVHIAVTVIIDAAIAIPEDWQLPIQRHAAEFHIRANGDFLFATRPSWLRGLVWLELVFQLPYFFWASWALAKGSSTVYLASFAYGLEAAVSTFACIIEILWWPHVALNTRLALASVYIPTLLIPLYIAYDFSDRISKSMRAGDLALLKRKNT